MDVNEFRIWIDAFEQNIYGIIHVTQYIHITLYVEHNTTYIHSAVSRFEKHAHVQTRTHTNTHITNGWKTIDEKWQATACTDFSWKDSWRLFVRIDNAMENLCEAMMCAPKRIDRKCDYTFLSYTIHAMHTHMDYVRYIDMLKNDRLREKERTRELERESIVQWCFFKYKYKQERQMRNIISSQMKFQSNYLSILFSYYMRVCVYIYIGEVRLCSIISAFFSEISWETKMFG